MSQQLLALKNLTISFKNEGDAEGVGAPDAPLLPAVRGVDLEIADGECLALVGESGCGKSITAFSLLGLSPGEVRMDGYTFAGEEVHWTERGFVHALRGEYTGFVFQDALTALDPIMRVGTQLGEAIRGKMGRLARQERMVSMLESVGIPDPETRLKDYPHQLSGGMRQRVMIAAALINNPRLLIADEPTTSLDVTIQAQILDLFKKMRRARGMSLLFITHDLGIVEDIADRVAVMYAGRIVESGPIQAVLASPAHPYTRGLLDSVPSLFSRKERFSTIPGRVPTLEDARTLSGCLFAPRCAFADAACAEVPVLKTFGSGHACACFHPLITDRGNRLNTEGDHA